MEKPSNTSKQTALFNQLIGLGSSSKTKSYYPVLVQKMEELRIEKEKYQSIFLNAREGIFRATLNGKITDMNPAMLRILCGEKPAQCISGDFFIQRFLPDKFLWIKIVVELEKNLTAFNLETLINQFGDEQKWASFNLNLTCIDDDFKVIEGIVEDVTEQKNAVEELNRTKMYLNNVIDSMPSILIGIDSYGLVTSINQQGQDLCKIDKAAALGRQINELFPHCTDFFLSYLAANSDEITRTKLSHVEDGELQYQSITIYPLIFEGTKEAIVRIDDITETEKKEKQLQRAQKMEVTGHLAGGIAHDFNNLLTGSLGAVSILKTILKQGALTNDLLLNNLDIIESASKKSAKMVRQLLTLSRKQKSLFSLCDLRELMEQPLNLFKTSMDKNIHLSLDITDTPAHVLADAGQIEQVLLNLLVNANHAMTIMRKPTEAWGGQLQIRIKPGGSLQLPDLTTAQPFWKITIKDSGVGMSKEVLENIFTPFFTTKPQDQGTGLGLPMAYNIITEHKGQIEIKSEHGVGTKVTLLLPACNIEQPVVKSPRISDNQGTSGKGTILVIDDEPVVREIAEAILNSFGYSVLTTESGKEGIELYKHHFPDINVVLLDMSMPEMSGSQVYQKLKEFDPAAKVVLASGNPNDSRVKELIEKQKVIFQEKPFTYEKLTSTIHWVNSLK